jgi:hypothetical protein
MFKAGDKVRCLMREFGNEIVGNIYIVDSMIDDFLDLRIKADNFGYPNTY